MANYKSLDEKTKQAFEMIEQGVKDVYSSESFKRYLSCLSKFHSYSLNNTLLILAQKPTIRLQFHAGFDLYWFVYEAGCEHTHGSMF